jgi:hypothetical protein
MEFMDRGRLRRFCLALALAGSTPIAATAASFHPGQDAVARFDAALATGLPAQTGELTIRARLAGGATYSDGLGAELYDVRFRDREALAVRHGDSLRIASTSDGRLHSTAYTAGQDRVVETDIPLEGPATGHPVDEEPPQDADEPQADSPTDTAEPRDLHVFAFVHDDVALDDGQLFERFFAWWIKRMEFDVLEDRRIHVHLRRAVPGLTDASYGHTGSLHRWGRAVRNYTDPYLPEPVAAPYIRHILLVKGKEVEPRAAGVANGQPGSLAMASTSGSVVVPAHEIGHMLGASHGHAERRYTGPFSTCDTIMYPVDPTVPCKAYSLPNVKTIRDTMRYARSRRYDRDDGGMGL